MLGSETEPAMADASQTPGQKERNAIAILAALDDGFCLPQEPPALKQLINMKEEMQEKKSDNVVVQHKATLPHKSSMALSIPPRHLNPGTLLKPFILMNFVFTRGHFDHASYLEYAPRNTLSKHSSSTFQHLSG
jgi:hypothetical protein